MKKTILAIVLLFSLVGISVWELVEKYAITFFKARGEL